MKLLTAAALFLVLLFASVCQAQDGVCTKQEGDTPTIRGFRLGMTVDEVKRTYTMVRDRSDATGYFSERVAGLWLSDQQKQGVSSVELGFLDGRVVSVIVAYDNSTKWESVEQLGAAVSNSLSVPPLWIKKTDPTEPTVNVFGAL